TCAPRPDPNPRQDAAGVMPAQISSDKWLGLQSKRQYNAIPGVALSSGARTRVSVLRALVAWTSAQARLPARRRREGKEMRPLSHYC
ncbi:MAG: hypothetical protein ACK4UU_00255, partial [Fimbriimonadales bacterium]